MAWHSHLGRSLAMTGLNSRSFFFVLNELSMGFFQIAELSAVSRHSGVSTRSPSAILSTCSFVDYGTAHTASSIEQYDRPWFQISISFCWYPYSSLFLVARAWLLFINSHGWCGIVKGIVLQLPVFVATFEPQPRHSEYSVTVDVHSHYSRSLFQILAPNSNELVRSFWRPVVILVFCCPCLAKA